MPIHDLTAAPEARTHLPVVIIGAGQAGMSASWHLCQAGVEHVVLERNTRFHAWKNQRWDSFCLVTPNWQCRLPGFPYSGDDPGGFMLKDEIVEYVEAFAESFDAPLREGVTVSRVARDAAGRIEVDTDGGLWSADHVIVASGGYDRPITPPFAAGLDPSITQLHTRDYTGPNDIPEGRCLVVGTGQSGVQLMEDLHIAGRDVSLAVGPAPRSPRQYRGRDATDWLHAMGYYDITIDQTPDPKATEAKTNHYMSGRDGGHEIDLRRFAKDGLPLYGSVTGMDGTLISFAPDLEKNLDDADKSYVGIREMIDAYIAREGIDAPVEPPFEKVWRPATEITEIDAAEEGITSVLWCIGFRPDYSWLQLDCLDPTGRPVHRRGVCENPGVYFLGLSWLNTWGSGRFLSVGEDAEYVTGVISERLDKHGRDRRYG
ncbi:putative flavoprotein involved in K+ transport [Roseivivax halotolerans]|uniref:Putative flavoprotein involved in K+ transport n=1 Tax=Roseivivax halotolerans TaxID=93684 RepID=A0A1I6A9E5_9RHOB|nr:MSMEG_0569 family flavin-dependent oxidoreductase [Roseivivax halotolerans]SFQ65275.1 putative flavoprotein involved in K+ transport [Roseivivax halotolerans]